MKIKARAPKVGKECEVEYDFGKDLTEMIAKFGERVVYDLAVDSAVIRLQSLLRSALERDLNPQEVANRWIPGVKTAAARDPLAAIKAAYAAMSPEEKKAFLQQLAQMAQG